MEREGDDLGDEEDWGWFDQRDTSVEHLDEFDLDEVPPADGVPDPDTHEHVTAPHDLRDLEGYEVGHTQGRAEMLEEVLTAFRLSLIEGGTDTGLAHLMAERLRRWMKVPDNAELVRVVLAPKEGNP